MKRLNASIQYNLYIYRGFLSLSRGGQSHCSKTPYQNFMGNATTNLEIIAELKTEEIRKWYNDLITDANPDIR